MRSVGRSSSLFSVRIVYSLFFVKVVRAVSRYTRSMIVRTFQNKSWSKIEKKRMNDAWLGIAGS